jgi:GNAT superfamily N-acetyltransferase
VVPTAGPWADAAPRHGLLCNDRTGRRTRDPESRVPYKAAMADITLTLTAEPDAEDLKMLGEGLAAYNDASVGPADRVLLAVFLREKSGGIVGGLSGYTGWGWLYVQWLWLSEALRGQGWAAKLLAAAEAEAVARGCHGAYIDTFNPTALGLYRRLGYTPFGALEDFPKGHTRTFLEKRLS